MTNKEREKKLKQISSIAIVSTILLWAFNVLILLYGMHYLHTHLGVVMSVFTIIVLIVIIATILYKLTKFIVRWASTEYNKYYRQKL